MPEGFELQIEKRLQERQASKAQQEEAEEEEELHKFKSQPLPKKILEGVVVSSEPLPAVQIYKPARFCFYF